MSKFKVGDRVAVYSAELDLWGEKGKVNGLLQEGRLYVQLDNPNHLADTPRLHERQCRRLKKRERRRVWVKYHAGAVAGWNLSGKMPADADKDASWVEFIEVRPKK